MGWFSKTKRAVNKATKRVGRKVKRQASKHGGKLLRRAVVVGVASGATFFAGPAAGAVAAKITKEVL